MDKCKILWRDVRGEALRRVVASLGSSGLFSFFASRLSSYICNVVSAIDNGPSRPWSDRYLFSAFNAFKRHRTNNIETR
jgi:hypothetical protein